MIEDETLYGLMAIAGLFLLGMSFGIALQPIFNNYVIILVAGFLLFFIGLLMLQIREMTKLKRKEDEDV